MQSAVQHQTRAALREARKQDLGITLTQTVKNYRKDELVERTVWPAESGTLGSQNLEKIATGAAIIAAVAGIYGLADENSALIATSAGMGIIAAAVYPSDYAAKIPSGIWSA